jgi:glucose-1-phosphate cytidylyltransferase
MSAAAMPPAMILCGGQGTRIRDVSELLPKPMVPIGSQPIVWHIMKTYAAFGVKRFILCLGYKKESFKDYFLNYRARAADLTIQLGTAGGITYHNGHGEEDWEVTLADTGDATMTGGRVARAARYLRPEDREVFLTYGDGVANIDISALLAHHRRENRAMTVTAVHPASRFGEIRIEGTQVSGFHEKPQTYEGLINGGFLVLDRRAIERYVTDDDTMVFEQQPMRRATEDGELSAYVHEGFWQCMDTAREHQLLDQLYSQGRAPWTEAWGER